MPFYQLLLLATVVSVGFICGCVMHALIISHDTDGDDDAAV
jgi:hypothetical protein